MVKTPKHSVAPQPHTADHASFNPPSLMEPSDAVPSPAEIFLTEPCSTNTKNIECRKHTTLKTLSHITLVMILCIPLKVAWMTALIIMTYSTN